jgi:hypothetical protein
MSELKGLSAGVRTLVTDENFRNGSQSAVEYETYVVELGLGRRCRCPLLAVLEEETPTAERVRRLAHPAYPCDSAADTARAADRRLGVSERRPSLTMCDGGGSIQRPEP